MESESACILLVKKYPAYARRETAITANCERARGGRDKGIKFMCRFCSAVGSIVFSAVFSVTVDEMSPPGLFLFYLLRYFYCYSLVLFYYVHAGPNLELNQLTFYGSSFCSDPTKLQLTAMFTFIANNSRVSYLSTIFKFIRLFIYLLLTFAVAVSKSRINAEFFNLFNVMLYLYYFCLKFF